MSNEKEFDFDSAEFDSVDYENMSDEDFANDPFVKWLRATNESSLKEPSVYVPNPKMISLAEDLIGALREYAKGFVYGDVPVIRNDRIDDILLVDFTASDLAGDIGSLLVKFIPLVSDFSITGKLNERVTLTFAIQGFFIKMKS